MSATNSVETAILGLIFNGTAWADFAENDSSSPATTFYVSLHTSDPGETGTQASSEATYTGYSRVAVTRDSGGFTVSGNAARNTATVTFGKATAGTETITYVGLGTASSGTGSLLLSNPLNSSLSITPGVTPLFEAGGLEFTCD